MPSTAPHRILACSLERTLVLRPSDAGGLELVKLFERGSEVDAKAEAARASALQVPGVVRYRFGGRDPQTSRPCVVLDYHEGIDLGRWLREHGPLSVTDACRLGARVAAIVADLHSARAGPGYAHCDLKPSNILVLGEDPVPATAEVLLLDLEHVEPLGGGKKRGFTGGTYGYAPPEAYRGAAPSAAFDAFGFGATLHELLTGSPPFRGRDTAELRDAVLAGARRSELLAGLPQALVALLDACLAPEPAQRPALADVVQQLRCIAEARDDALGKARAAVLAGALADAELHLATADAMGARHAALARLLARRRRLMARVPAPQFGDEPANLETMAAHLAQLAPRVQAWLTRFPADRSARELRQRVERELSAMLLALPARVANHKRNAAFPRALTALEHAKTALAVLGAAGLDLNSGGDGSQNGRASALARAPLAFLQATGNDVQQAARAHQSIVDRLSATESALDLVEANAVLESTQSLYAGASEIAAALKERVHRFAFYLERLAGPSEAVQRLEEQLVWAELPISMAPVTDLQRRCAVALPSSGERPARRPLGLRGLRSGLHDLLAEFPAADTAVAPAAEALDHAFRALSERAWGLLQEGQDKLEVVPIPIRPLQSVINRIDTLRQLEVLIDLPERTRAALLDQHERLRLKVDQARTTRDRIARGAEEAARRGHYTTALYDMERAIDQFATETDELDVAGASLSSRLAETKRRKEALDAAATRNVQLAARYAELLDDPSSTHEARLQALVERRKTLTYLLENLQDERGELYQRDHREVDVAERLERSDRAQTAHDSAVDARERERIARATLDLLHSGEPGVAIPGRILRAVDHWDHLLQRARDEMRRRRRRRWVRAAQVAGVALIAALLFQVARPAHSQDLDPLAGLERGLGNDLATAFDPSTVTASEHPDPVRACVTLDRCARRLEECPLASDGGGALAEVSHALRQLVDEVQRGANAVPQGDLPAWSTRVGNDLADFSAALTRSQPAFADHERGQPLVARLQTLGSRVLAVALLCGASHAESEAERETVRQLAEQAAPAFRINTGFLEALWPAPR